MSTTLTEPGDVKLTKLRRNRHVKLTNAGADGPTSITCTACGWRGRRVYPPGIVFQPRPCPQCGGREFHLTSFAGRRALATKDRNHE